MKKLLIEAPYKTQSGYGHRSLDLVRSLISLNKYDIQLISLPWGSSKFIDIPDLKEYETKSITPDIYIHVGLPNETKPKGKFNILFTAGIETDKCSREWLQGCNLMDLIVVSSEHAKTVFESTMYIPPLSIEKPIEVLFEGIDLDLYKPTNELTPYLKDQLSIIKNDFNFLFIGQWLPGELGHDRKDIGKLIETYTNTFQHFKNKPGLILKTNINNYSKIDLERLNVRIKSIKRNHDVDIYLIHGELTDEEINQLYNFDKVKSFVTFTHAEGWGKDLAQFGTCGKPIIATNWSGHLDFLKSFIELDGKLEYVHQSALMNTAIIKDAKWFYVDYTNAASKMLDMYLNYSKYKEIGLNQQREIQQFSMKNMTKKLNEILTKYKL